MEALEGFAKDIVTVPFVVDATFQQDEDLAYDYVWVTTLDSDVDGADDNDPWWVIQARHQVLMIDDETDGRYEYYKFVTPETDEMLYDLTH